MKTEQLDWVPIPLWVACAGNALRAGLVQFPDSAFLNIQLGTFEAVLRQEPSVGWALWRGGAGCSWAGGSREVAGGASATQHGNWHLLWLPLTLACLPPFPPARRAG